MEGSKQRVPNGVLHFHPIFMLGKMLFSFHPDRGAQREDLYNSN